MYRKGENIDERYEPCVKNIDFALTLLFKWNIVRTNNSSGITLKELTV